MLRLNRFIHIAVRLIGAAALWIAGCASEPPTLYPGPTPETGYVDYGYANYVDDGIYYASPVWADGGFYYAPYGSAVTAQKPASLLSGAPVFRPPSVNGPSFHPPGAPAKPGSMTSNHPAFKDSCVRTRTQACR